MSAIPNPLAVALTTGIRPQGLTWAGIPLDLRHGCPAQVTRAPDNSATVSGTRRRHTAETCGPLVPRQATFARVMTSCSALSLALRFRQAM